MADGAAPGRLERVAEAVIEGLRAFRRGETSLASLAGVLRRDLGPNERLFIAGAAGLALDVEHKDKLGEALGEDAARETVALDPRGCTERSYETIIKRHRSVGNEDRAREFERKLEDLRARWAEEDAA